MAKAKILVIDDDKAMLAITKRSLEAAGYEAVTSDSPLRLPQLTEREKPDLVLLDLEMPTLTGERVLDLAALFDFLKKTPIVLYSGRNEEELKTLVARSQARGFIRKGASSDSLISQVEKFLREPQR